MSQYHDSFQGSKYLVIIIVLKIHNSAYSQQLPNEQSLSSSKWLNDTNENAPENTNVICLSYLLYTKQQQDDSGDNLNINMVKKLLHLLAAQFAFIYYTHG